MSARPRSGPAVKGPASQSPPPPGEATRKAALLLHALDTADQAWLLARLDAAEAATLRALLDELQALGIPADRKFLADVLGAVAPARSAEPHAPPGDASSVASIARVSRASADEMAALLRDEPAGLVASLLRLHDWPWKAALLRRLGAATAARVDEILSTAAPVPAGALRGERVLEAVARRLDAVQRDTAGAAGRTAGGFWRAATVLLGMGLR